MNQKYSILIILFFVVFSCNLHQKTENSIYIWKAELSLDQTDYDFFAENNINNLYIRLFDVEWKNNETPISILHFDSEIPKNLNVIPVVYIKNQVLKNLYNDQLEDFADKLYHKINTVYSDNFPNHQITEIQLDCDWSETTRDKYFELLKYFQEKTEKNVTISVTIRLHQIKYQQNTGIPPVDKGVLMYYNMGEVKNQQEPNAIINNEIGMEYLNENSLYPLPLSLALPIYSWGVWYDWQNSVNVVYQINVNTIDTLKYLQKIEGNKYKIIQDTVVEEKYLRIGDIIRMESSSIENLEQAKQVCKPLFSKNYEIILYNYNYSNTNLLNKNDLEKIYIR